MDAETKNSIVNVGGGRGFVVEHGRYKYIITAAHCLPDLPPAHMGASLEEKTYGKLIGPIGGDQIITVECLFVDPVSDIAILGEPDGQELHEQSEQYLEFTDAISPITIREGKRGEEIWALSLDGEFRPKTIMEIIQNRTLMLSPGLIFKSGMWDRRSSVMMVAL
jgi:hypothetical protein